MFRSRLLIPLLLLLASSVALAQTRSTSSLQVHVIDASGAVVQSAEVSLNNAESGLLRTAISNDRGDVHFAELPLTGTYEIRVQAPGFATATRGDLHLDAGKAAFAQIKLSVQTSSETTTVTSTESDVDTSSAELAVRLDGDELNATPILGRKLSSATLLDSSVRSARGTGDLFLGQTLFVIDGGGRRQTTYSVDNTNGDDVWGRQSLFTAIPFSAVQEFAILRNPISAEYGRTSGSAINIVTRSGTNQLHGDFIGLWRPTQLEANNPLSIHKTGDKLVQGSATISGPIIADRTHFLVSEEYSRDDRGATIISPLALNSTFIGNARQELLLARIDHQLTARNSLALRANIDRLKDTNPQDAVSGFALPSTARTFRRNTYALAASLSSAISNTTVNDARLQFQLGSPITQFTPAQFATAFNYPNFATLGQSQYGSLLNHQYEGADTLTRIIGRHTFKAGADVIYSSSGGFGQEFGGGFLLGQFTIKPNDHTPPAQLTIANASSFQQTFGNQNYNIKNTLGAVFLNDNWRVNSSLTLDLGVRYEIESFTDDHNNVAPRIGLSYALPDRKTVLRGSYGIFYSEERTDLAAADKINGPAGALTFQVSAGQFGFPTSLTALPAYPAGAVVPARNITVRAGQAAFVSQFFDPSQLRFYPSALLNPYSQQWTASVEQDLGNGWLLSLDYLGQRTYDIERPVDLNAPSPFLRTAPGQFRNGCANAACAVIAADATRPLTPANNGYRRIVASVNEGRAWYDGVHLDLRKHLSPRATALFSYTYSHTQNNVEVDGTSQDPNDQNLRGDFEKATSLLDQRHRLSLSGAYNLPFGFTFGSFITAASGRPYNITTGVDNNGDGSTSDRPVIDGVVIGRNAGRGTPTYDVASYIAKTVKITERTSISLRAEGFNLANHLNVVGRNGTYGNGAAPLPTLGTPLAGISNVEPARQFQFQARLQF